jgi:hypothetical protein
MKLPTYIKYGQVDNIDETSHVDEIDPNNLTNYIGGTLMT